MKKFKFYMIAIAVILLASCSKDDDQPLNVEDSMILGEWNLEEFDYQGKTSGNVEGNEITTTYEGMARNINATLNFKEDNTFQGSGNYDIVLTLQGTTVTQPVNFDSSGTWKLEGNSLIAEGLRGDTQEGPVAGASESIMEISEISDRHMVLIIDQEAKVTQDGIDYTVTQSGKYVLAK